MRKYLILIILFVFTIADAGQWKVVSNTRAMDSNTLRIDKQGRPYFFHSFGRSDGYSIKGYSELKRSTDKGQSWEPLLSIEWTKRDSIQGYCSDNFSEVSQFSVVNDSVFFLFFKHNLLFMKSTNHGESWNVHVRADTGKSKEGKYTCGEISRIQMFDENIGYFNYSDETKIYFTFDGWETIEKINFPDDSTDVFQNKWVKGDVLYFSIGDSKKYPNFKDRYRYADYHSILKSTDRGKTWTSYENDDSVLVTRIDFVDKNIGFKWGMKYDPDYPESEYKVNVIYRTTDGGESWENILFKRDSSQTWGEGIRRFVYMDSLNYVATPCNTYKHNASETGHQIFYHTSDAGETWTTEYFNEIISDGSYDRITEDSRINNLQAINPESIYCQIYKWCCRYFPDGVDVEEMTTPENYTDIQIYPSPALQGSSVNLYPGAKVKGSFTAELYNIRSDMVSRIVYDNYLDGSVLFKIPESIPAGVYILGIMDKDGNFKGRPLVVE